MNEDEKPFDAKVPEAVKKTPRCPLCHATFDRRFDPARQTELKKMFVDAIRRCKTAANKTQERRARQWCELLEASIKSGAAEVFLCHFCKIGIATNDPMVGKWEEIYAQGEKILCPNPKCEAQEMRFFCTSTGYMQSACPKKGCGAKMELSEPDRSSTRGFLKVKEGDKSPASEAARQELEQAAAKQLFDAHGNPIVLPNIDRPIATPQDPSIGQLGVAKDDLPASSPLIPLPPPESREGTA